MQLSIVALFPIAYYQPASDHPELHQPYCSRLVPSPLHQSEQSQEACCNGQPASRSKKSTVPIISYTSFPSIASRQAFKNLIGQKQRALWIAHNIPSLFYLFVLNYLLFFFLTELPSNSINDLLSSKCKKASLCLTSHLESTQQLREDCLKLSFPFPSKRNCPQNPIYHRGTAKQGQ